MKRLAKIFIPTILILFALVLNGKEVDKSRAQQVAMSFLYERAPESINEIIISSDLLIEENGIPLFYIFNTNVGFIILSANDVIYPVLGYSFESQYTDLNLPPAFQSWMNHYKEQIEYSALKNCSSSENVREIWKKYESENVTKLDPKESVNPLIYTKWSQGCYYNGQFPEETNGPCGYLWTGCVATAMGQIMKYYNFPKNGTGSNTYYTSYGVQEADFGNTNYNWAEMSYHLSEDDYSVAELLYHSAISVNSILTPNGTGAYDFDARDALVDYFKYDESAAFLWRNDYSGDWESLLRSELDLNRPVLYGGVDLSTQAGHTFVCDGYQDTTHFHFNWGWDGFYDGYYYVDSLVAGGNYFNYQHDAIVEIQPDISGIIELYPPEELVAEVEGHSVELNWLASSIASSLELLGYNVFRNDTLVNIQIIDELSFTDTEVPSGSHNYKVRSVFIGNTNGPFDDTETYISSISEIGFVSFTMYPNPASDFLIIEFDDNQITRTEVRILDISGRLILQNSIPEFNDNRFEIMLEILSGIYLVEVKRDDSKTTRKLLIR